MRVSSVYAPLTPSLDNTSCESDEYTDFNLQELSTPPNDAREVPLLEHTGFHESFVELWCCVYALLPYNSLLQSDDSHGYGEAWLSARREPNSGATEEGARSRFGKRSYLVMLSTLSSVKVLKLTRRRDGLIRVFIKMSCYVWWLCMATNISVQYNGELLPDSIMLTEGYYHRGARLCSTGHPGSSAGNYVNF